MKSVEMSTTLNLNHIRDPYLYKFHSFVPWWDKTMRLFIETIAEDETN